MKHTKRHRRRRRSTRGGGLFRLLFGGYVQYDDEDAPRLRKKCMEHYKSKNVDPSLIINMCGGLNPMYVPALNGVPVNYPFHEPKPSLFRRLFH